MALLMPRESERDGKEVRDEAEALARDMAHDMIEFTRVAWKLAGHVGKFALRAAEEVADEAEKSWERQRQTRGKGK